MIHTLGQIGEAFAVLLAIVAYRFARAWLRPPIPPMRLRT